jgi:hypothetical protein
MEKIQQQRRALLIHHKHLKMESIMTGSRKAGSASPVQLRRIRRALLRSCRAQTLCLRASFLLSYNSASDVSNLPKRKRSSRSPRGYQRQIQRAMVKRKGLR